MYRLQIGSRHFTLSGNSEKNTRTAHKRSLVELLSKCKHGPDHVELKLDGFGILLIHGGIDAKTIPEGSFLSAWKEII